MSNAEDLERELSFNALNDPSKSPKPLPSKLSNFKFHESSMVEIEVPKLLQTDTRKEENAVAKQIIRVMNMEDE